MILTLNFPATAHALIGIMGVFGKRCLSEASFSLPSRNLNSTEKSRQGVLFYLFTLSADC
jgi:hypothetical protein